MKPLSLLRITFIFGLLLAQTAPALAREGDTLTPIAIDAPALETWPENLLHENDTGRIEERVREARTSGVPLAVRIVDTSIPEEELPYQVRPYVGDGSSEPLTEEERQAAVEAWIKAEPIETSADANDGFLLLVLVPEDRTQTEAIWWIGPNALPLNGLTQENILATQAVMEAQFTEGNMPNGVYLGISEFSYNIQFGDPERLVRTELNDALYWATIPLAIGTALAGISIPMLAIWLSRRNGKNDTTSHDLTPWEAAALHWGRARQEIPAAMLLDGVHRGTLTPLANGGLRIEDGPTNPAIDALRPYADDEGVVPPIAVYEIEGITSPIRDEIENTLASVGAMTSRAKTDRTWILLAMGFATFLATMTIVPSIISMSAVGIFAIAVAVIGIAAGWWWLSYRSYTSPGGKKLVDAWLESASSADRHLFDTVILQDPLTVQEGGPNVHNQLQVVRRLRGLGSG